MKRYLVFAGHAYYPSGGWSDYQGNYDTLEEINRPDLIMSFDWVQVVDRDTLTVVEEIGS